MKKIKYPGLKPPICKKKGCLASHENFGLGIDVEQEILDNALVLDLLLNFAYSAAIENLNATEFDTFNPYPENLEDEEGKRYFMKKDKRNHKKVSDLINKIPKTSKLVKYIEEGKFKEKKWMELIQLLINLFVGL